ncbi:queuine tRNA-ribosyltransferase subunit qtrtd1-like protein, partial [Trifolium pratense]
MKLFSVKKAWRVRVGALELGGGLSIETPALLISTRKGLPHFIPPDLLPSLPSPDSHLLQLVTLYEAHTLLGLGVFWCGALTGVPLSDMRQTDTNIYDYTNVFVYGAWAVLGPNKPGQLPGLSLEGLSPATIAKIGGIHKLVGLNEYGIAAVARDSIHSLPECKGATKFGPTFETPCGRLLIKPKDYVEMISCLRPNIWATLADEVPAWVSDKRNKTSVDRTLRWLDDCLALNPAVGSVFGAIVGGPSLDERKRCAEEVAKRNVAGYWIGGFGLGEAIDERPALLHAIVDVLPDAKPRMICGLGLP